MSKYKGSFAYKLIGFILFTISVNVAGNAVNLAHGDLTAWGIMLGSSCFTALVYSLDPKNREKTLEEVVAAAVTAAQAVGGTRLLPGADTSMTASFASVTQTRSLADDLTPELAKAIVDPNNSMDVARAKAILSEAQKANAPA